MHGHPRCVGRAVYILSERHGTSQPSVFSQTSHTLSKDSIQKNIMCHDWVVKETKNSTSVQFQAPTWGPILLSLQFQGFWLSGRHCQRGMDLPSVVTGGPDHSFSNSYFTFMVYVCVPHVCLVPTEAKEGVRSPGTGVKDDREPTTRVPGIDLGSSGRAAVLLACKSSLSILSFPNSRP